MQLEICANSYQSAKNAQRAGAHRIELCQELSVGGLTPSFGLIKKVVEDLSIKTFVLIRPRSGNFLYNNSEFEIMKQDIMKCKELGCHGIVSGVLDSNQNIDVERTKELVECSKPLPFTFHRAFDIVPEPMKALNELIDLGVERILTSGQESMAISGIELLKQLKTKSNNRIIILPGSGIKTSNVKIFVESGFNEIHASASSTIEELNTSSMFYAEQTESNVQSIKSLIKSMQNEV